MSLTALFQSRFWLEPSSSWIDGSRKDQGKTKRQDDAKNFEIHFVVDDVDVADFVVDAVVVDVIDVAVLVDAVGVDVVDGFLVDVAVVGGVVVA